MIRCSTTGDAMALRWASVDGRETWATGMNWDSVCSSYVRRHLQHRKGFDRLDPDQGRLPLGGPRGNGQNTYR